MESRTQNGEATGACREEVDGEVMLANALKRMVDEVVGESRYVWTDPVRRRR